MCLGRKMIRRFDISTALLIQRYCWMRELHAAQITTLTMIDSAHHPVSQDVIFCQGRHRTNTFSAHVSNVFSIALFHTTSIGLDETSLLPLKPGCCVVWSQHLGYDHTAPDAHSLVMFQSSTSIR
jgi:hypothetical protein